MPELTDFELVLINGEVVRQDVGYNSMLGKLEPENWFWFEGFGIVERYEHACTDIKLLQKYGQNVHLTNSKVDELWASVMCIPAKSILCIRMIEPRIEHNRTPEEEHEVRPLSDELRRFSRHHGEIKEEEETDEQRQERIRTKRFERRRRPVIRRKK